MTLLTFAEEPLLCRVSLKPLFHAVSDAVINRVLLCREVVHGVKVVVPNGNVDRNVWKDLADKTTCVHVQLDGKLCRQVCLIFRVMHYVTFKRENRIRYNTG